MTNVSAAVVVLFSLLGGSARADGVSAACERLRAEARAEAVVLYAPRIVIEGARAPSVIDAGDPVGATDGLQARASLGFSAIDALRGRAVERIADAECARTGAADRAARVLTSGARTGELAALRAQIAYLTDTLPRIDSMVEDAVTRFERQRATSVEVNELRVRRAVFRVELATAQRKAGELEELERTGSPGTPDLVALARDVRAAERAVADRQASLRALSAWRLDVRTGVAGGERADWFAVLELGYSLGQPFQARANRRAVSAREAELAADDRALPGQLEQLARVMKRSAADLGTEVAALDAELAVLRTERDRLAATETDAARPLVTRFTLDIFELEARRAFSAALATARRSLAGDQP
ncbi:MAG: hypothetical protein JNL83_17580 [Myxococcales bacterium]|nr:hypothetical protein [Myxococcales bacterium]